MRKLFLISFCILQSAFCITFAQTCDIPLRPIVTQATDGSSHQQVIGYVTNKLRTLTGNNSSVGGMDNSQFGIAMAYDVINKQIVGGAPTKIIYDVNVSLYIVDLKGQKVYASYAKEVKGIGNNETKALINTFQKLNTNNREIKAFIENGKRKIIEYYDQNYPNIITSAQTMAAMKNFDAAIYTLMSIPECCRGYERALSELKTVYKKFVDQHCSENIAQARAAWLAAPNSEGAATASVFLSEIYPDAACYSEAKELANEIKSQLKKQQGKEWDFMMRQYSDAISLQQQQLNVMRDIQVAYANSQPKTEITNVFWR